jgi:hypothetical protein
MKNENILLLSGLQSPPPYDVSEKVREANRLLEEDQIVYNNKKSPRVKFKEQIVEFEIVLSDFSSDEAASADEWLTSQLKESETNNDKTMLDTDSDEGDTCLLPLEEEVKLGFPHQATYRESDEDDEPRSSPEIEQIGESDAGLQPSAAVDGKTPLPLVILVPRDNEYSDRSEDLLTEQFAHSSPVSDDIPNSCDGFSISTDILSSKLDTESPVTELDISEEFHCSLDLNKDSNLEIIQRQKVVNKQLISQVSNTDKNEGDNKTSNNVTKRKESLKLQHYRKSIEGYVSSEWNQFQTVADVPTPRDHKTSTSHSPTPARAKTISAELKDRPSSGAKPSKPSSASLCMRDRPWTAPNSNRIRRDRDLCGSRWSSSHLPTYNGMRSEYGLSKDQLEERKRYTFPFF